MVREEIRQKGLYILNNLGGVDDSDYPLNYSGRFSVWCDYKIEGLIIRSDDLTYSNNLNEVKKSMRDINIKYDEKEVYNSKTGIYIPGFWEELFETLYEKVPKILADRKAKRELLNQGDIFFQRTLANVTLDTKIGNDIVIKNETHDPDDWYDTAWRQRSVFHKGNLVLEAFQTGYYDKLSVIKYVPGEWEEEVVKYVQELEEKRKKSQNKLDEKRLRYIRNL